MSYFMPNEPRTFAIVLKELRLKSRIDSLRELCNILADSDFVIEESTLSRWQSGTRLPKNRALLTTLIKIFAIRNAITTLEEANQFLRLAGLVPLSKAEEEYLALKSNGHVVFSLPPKPDIIGTDEIMNTTRQLLESENGRLHIVLHGLPGTGKSSTAISVAHQFLSYFNKGIVWLRVLDRSIIEIENMLLNILRANIADPALEGNPLDMIRSKNFLLVLDNVESKRSLIEIADHFSSSSYIATTATYPDVADRFHTLEIKPFQDIYVYEIFSRSAGRQLTSQEKKIVSKIAGQLGNLPLPLLIIANTLKSRLNEEDLGHVLQLLKAKEAGLDFFQDNFTHIVSAFEVLFDQLTTNEKIVLQSIASKRLPVFEVAKLEPKSLSPSVIQWTVFTLSSKSLLDKTSEGNYRIHPVLYRFLRIKSRDKNISAEETGKLD